MGKTKLTFNIIWLIEILKIYQDEQLLINYYVLKWLILLKSLCLCFILKRGLASSDYKFFDKNFVGANASGGAVKSEIMSNQRPSDLAAPDLAEESHKQITRKFEKCKVYSSFKDNIWVVELADMQLINKFKKETRFLLCVNDIFSKYSWVVPLKDKRGITITIAF